MTALRRYPGTSRLENAAMDARLLEAITGKLEAGKTAGWLSEYLVAWHGPREKLAPEVTVWRAADWHDDTVKAYLAGMLSDLVPESRIVIADT
jgi:hypothetical protein